MLEKSARSFARRIFQRFMLIKGIERSHPWFLKPESVDRISKKRSP
ncbi:hypothetical protein [Merismopedia glauca]|nr:hypothetical protein [Merismopedia glauca]